MKNINNLSIKNNKDKKIKKRLLIISSYLAVGLLFSLVTMYIALNFEFPSQNVLKKEISQYKIQLEKFNNRLLEYENVLQDLEYRDDNIYRCFLGIEPISKDVRVAGYGGTERYANFNNLTHGDIMKTISMNLDNFANRLYTETKSLDLIYDLAKEKIEFVKCVPAIIPVRETDLRQITSYYGRRTDPFYNVTKYHKGLDFALPIGNDVMATGNGIVEKVVQNDHNGYGKYIIINHGFGYKTLYGHLNKTNVYKGQKIKRGEKIGCVGNTGKSIGPHLHYEVIKDGKNVDPIDYFFKDISPEQYNVLIKLAEKTGKSMD